MVVPKLRQRKDGGYFVRSSGDSNSVNTFQITDEGVSIIERSGREIGEFFPNQLFFLLYDLGHLSTKDEKDTKSKIPYSNNIKWEADELSIEDRVEVALQIVETHGVNRLLYGDVAKWILTLIGKPPNVLKSLVSRIAEESGYRYETIEEYSEIVGSRDELLQAALCAHLQMEGLRTKDFDDGCGKKSDREVLGTDGDFVYLKTTDEDTRWFGIAGKIPDAVPNELSSQLDHAWGVGTGAAGLAALATNEVRQRYGVDGIVLPKERLEDFPVGSSPSSRHTGIPPNELSDSYEAFFTMREIFPEDVNPLWELAIESILFGGDGLADGNKSYGEQQAKSNEFKIAEYRLQYGNGERVTEFPAIDTYEPLEQDQEELDEVIQLPVAPDSKQVLPLNPDSEEIEDAFSLLNEFPINPGELDEDADNMDLLNPSRFPGISSDCNTVKPNELADLYECFRILIGQVPDEYTEWETALETVCHGTEHMSMSMSYRQQMLQRNTFSMEGYRDKYGNGERVTEFPTIRTTKIDESALEHLTESIYLPTTPESDETLPGSPVDSAILSALSKLQEFPAWPQAELYNDESEEQEGPLLDKKSLLVDTDIDTKSKLAKESDQSEEKALSSSSSSSTDYDASQQTQTDSANTDEDQADSTTEKTFLRQEQAGEQTISEDEITNSSSTTSVKYEDPQAEEAHRRAQQRDPSDVVELGEEIPLVLKEVDYSSRPATIMGTKNRLVIFVNEAPQDLSKHDSIRVKIVDYGGNNSSAEAVFVDYKE